MTSSEAAPRDPLHDLLQRQLELMQELGEVMREKQRLLVASETEGLSELSRSEEELAIRLARLEEQRISRLSRQLGIDAAALRGMHISELQDSLCAELPDGAVLDDLRTQISQLQQLQDDNRLLTDRLVEYGRLVINLVTQGDERVGYNSHGRPAEGTRRELLNCRI